MPLLGGTVIAVMSFYPIFVNRRCRRVLRHPLHRHRYRSARELGHLGDDHALAVHRLAEEEHSSEARPIRSPAGSSSPVPGSGARRPLACLTGDDRPARRGGRRVRAGASLPRTRRWRSSWSILGARRHAHSDGLDRPPRRRGLAAGGRARRGCRHLRRLGSATLLSAGRPGTSEPFLRAAHRERRGRARHQQSARRFRPGCDRPIQPCRSSASSGIGPRTWKLERAADRARRHRSGALEHVAERIVGKSKRAARRLRTDRLAPAVQKVCRSSTRSGAAGPRSPARISQMRRSGPSTGARSASTAGDLIPIVTHASRRSGRTSRRSTSCNSACRIDPLGPRCGVVDKIGTGWRTR